MKTAREQLLTPLQIIYEKSVRSGSVPKQWRHANVRAIYKKGTKGEASNYRPVSLTSIPCKILESIIKDALMHHLSENNLIKDSQHRFMTGKSCTTNLVTFLGQANRNIRQRETSRCILLGLCKSI